MFQQQSFFSTASSPVWNMNTIFNMSDLTKGVQQHLARVYTALAVALCMAAAGAYVDLIMNLGGFLSMIGSIGLFTWMMMTDPREESKRYGMLMGFAFCNGLTIGGLIELVLFVDPSILITAFLGTAVIFCCFSLSALLAERRSYLFLAGLLSSGISCLFLISIMNIFFASAMLYSLHLYLGLMIFCGYVLFDTQMIIEKASLGSRDYILHAGELFQDFLAIFVRLCIILLKNSEGRKKRERRRD